MYQPVEFGDVPGPPLHQFITQNSFDSKKKKKSNRSSQFEMD